MNKEEKYLNKYYCNDDSVSKVISLIESDQGTLFVYLNFSMHHKFFNISTHTEADFKEWKEPYEIEDFFFEEEDTVVAEHLIN